MSSEKLSNADRKEMKRVFKEAAKQEKAEAKAAKAAAKAVAKGADEPISDAKADQLSNKEAKAAAKLARAEAKADEKAARAQAKLDAKGGKSAMPDEKSVSPRKQKKAEKVALRQLELQDKMARYKQLRANVRRRRFAYVLFMILAIGVFAGSIWDILYNSSDMMIGVFAAYIFLFVYGFILLFSRQRHLEEVAEMRALERVFLEDPESGEVFQLAAATLPALAGLEFTSPVTGKFFRMPSLDAQQVERVLPSGALQSAAFSHNGVEGEVATFGKAPKAVKFR